MKLMIVDDSSIMRGIIRRSLMALGFSDVVESANADGALQLLRSEPLPDVMLLDWNMPGMTGLELLKMMKADDRYREIIVVMVTSESDQVWKDKAIEAGAFAFLNKPFDAVLFRKQVLERLGPSATGGKKGPDSDDREAGALKIDPDMQPIVDAFVVESREFLEQIDKDLLALEKRPGDAALVNSVFRALHTMKGNSKALGFEPINRLVHRTEDVVRKVRDGAMSVTPQVLDSVFTATDLVKRFIEDVARRRQSTESIDGACAALDAVLTGPPRQDGGGESHVLKIDDDMKEIVDAFVVESEDLCAGLERDCLALENAPENTKTVASVFRAFHTLKGNSRSLGFASLEKFVHKNEDLVRAVRDGKMVLRSEVVDTLLRSIGLVKTMIADIRRRTVGTYTLGPVFEELDLILKGDFDALKKRRSKTPAAVSPQLPQQEPAATTIRVDLAKLDGLIGAAGELVLERNRLLNYIQTVEQGGSGDELAEELDEIGAHLNILVSELQSGIMSTRMQPVGKVFNRYPRIVRDLSRDLGKQIEVNISGAETELDNTIIEEIGDPLVHLVRNCCDHGIETPDERQRNGKSSAGHVDIRAYQEGNFVIIVISDDGKGMDPELLKHTAVSKGVITQEAASAMSDAEAFQLIFAPGFSTAEKVTAVSGRGVGMDVVKTNIGRLSGIIDLESKKGEGTTVRIRLPLTLAATVGIEIEVGEERYLVPQENIVEIIRISHHAYAMVLEQKRFLFRNQYWNPLVDLREILGVSLNGRVRAAHGYIIVLGQAERRVGVLVDNVLQQHEVVVRPLGQYVARFSPAHANGATVMGDGSVVLILNAAHLIAHGNRERVAV